MLLPAILLFILFIVFSAFFSSSETAFISSNPYTIEYLEKKGSKKAGAVKKILNRVDDFLATILIGNTLANVAAASVATYIFVSFVPDRGRAVLYATIATTLFLLVFSEINPKIYAAYHPLKVSVRLAPLVRGFMVLFYPFVKTFTFLSSLIFPFTQKQAPGTHRSITADETKALLTTGLKGMSAFRKKMIAEILDIASRPVKEIMTPRPRIKAIEIGATSAQILEIIQSEEFSRFPVYRGRLDQIEGLIHTKDIIPYLIARQDLDLTKFLRKPFFIPESASVEKVLIQMQENAIHLAFVVDEFGNMDGIVTLEDIIEEIVGEIQDEYDAAEEELVTPAGENAFLIKGAAGIKNINQRLPFQIPESGEYTTLAGFFLDKFGRIPGEKDALVHGGHRFLVERMTKRHINLIRIEPLSAPNEKK
jgi:putative hemolysin